MRTGMPRMHRPRLLPATIAAMALLLVVKSMSLVWAATAATEAAPVPRPAEKVQPVATAATPLPPPAIAKPVDPPMSEAERSLLLDLRHRRGELDARARSLDQRDSVLAAAQARLSARVDELTALQSKLETLETARQSHDSANWVGLVHVYEAMKPRDAATIFDALDMQVLLPVLDRMSDRKAAPILAAMQPDRARLATQLLAELRTKSITPAGEKPASPADPKG
jgi:flagellar motility protein MotE (MotC chaperone)